MSWSAPAFANAFIWVDEPSHTTALDSANLAVMQSNQAVYAQSVGQSVINYVNSGTGSVPAVASAQDQDLVIHAGGRWARLPVGSTDQLIVVQSSGSVAYTKLQENNLASWGVEADGQAGNCCTPSPGNNTFVFTPLNGITSISSTDVGKQVLVYGAGPANQGASISNADGNAFVATITGVSGTTVTTNLYFPLNIVSTPVYSMHWGTDNTAAIANAITQLGRGQLKFPAGDILYYGPIDLSNVGSAQPTGNNNADFTLQGAGAGFGSWGGANNWGGPKGVTRLINLSRDEAIINAQSISYLVLKRFTVKQTRQFTVPDAGVIFLSNWGGGGRVEDVAVESAAPFVNDTWQGTFVTNAASITAVLPPGTSTPNTVQNHGTCSISPGDFVFGAFVAANTKVTSVSPLTGVVQLDTPLTGGGGGTASVSFLTCPANLGSGLWIDNPGTGGMAVRHYRATGFASPPQTIPLKGGATYLYRCSAALKFGALVYNQGGSQGGPTTTNITATTTPGSSVLSGVDNFLGWWPGGKIHVSSGDVTVDGGQVLKVDRVNSLAYLDKVATGSVSGSVSIRIQGSGANSGNITFDVCQSNVCACNIYGYGLSTAGALQGALTNSCTIITPKFVGTGLSGIPSGGQFPLSYGLLFESEHEEHTITSPHNEGPWHGMSFEGTDHITVISPICSSGSGYAGIGAGSGRNAVQVGGNDVDVRRMKVTQNGWDHAVTILSSAARAEVTYGMGVATTTGAEVVRNGSRAMITPLYKRPYRNNIITPLYWWPQNNLVGTQTANQWRFTRFVIQETGLFHDLQMWLNIADNVTPTHFWAAIYDCGELSAGNYSRLWDSGSVTSISSVNWQSMGDPALTVYEGQHLMVGHAFDAGSARVGTYNNLGANAAAGQLATNFLSNSGGLLPKLAATFAGSFQQPPSTISEANMVTGNAMSSLLGRSG